MKNLKNLNIGDTVYYAKNLSGLIVCGNITKIYSDGALVENKCCVDSKGNFIVKSCGTGGVMFGDLYSTAQEAFAEKNREHFELVSKYCDEITDVGTLLKFALNHCLNGDEYVDDAARAAYVEKAKELLDVDLEL